MKALVKDLKPTHLFVALTLFLFPLSLTAASQVEAPLRSSGDICCSEWGCEGGPDKCLSTAGYTCYKNGIEPCA